MAKTTQQPAEKTAVQPVFNKAQVDFLKQRTPPEAVQTRQGRGGRTFSYVSQQHVTRTLNEVFGFDWDFDVLWEQIGKTEAVVKGRLTVRAPNGQVVQKTQFGGSPIKRAKNGAPLGVADDLKAAGSDALKKCASLLGIGLDLYDEGNGNAAANGAASEDDDEAPF